MSVRCKIKLDELNDLNYSKLISIYSNQENEFYKKKYLIERYKRDKDFTKSMYESDVKEINVATAIEGELIDTASGYGLGKPITYYDKFDDNYKLEKKVNIFNVRSEFVKKIENTKANEYLDKYLEILKYNDEELINQNLFKRCLITGSADEMIYLDEEGKYRFTFIEDDDCICFVDTSINPKMIGFSRRIKYSSPIGYEDNYSYELYTNKKQVRYDESGNVFELNAIDLEILKIPFVRYDIKQSYIQNLISSIRGYELVTNNTKKILNYNDDALLMIKGYAFDNGVTEEEVKKVIDLIRSKGIMFLDSEDDTEAKWLSKDVNDETNQNHKNNLKDDIYTMAGTFNPSNDNMVYQNTLSLMFKLYGLETKMSTYDKALKSGFLERCKKITQLINVGENKNYISDHISITFSRNLPTNTNEELNLINQASNFLPLEELYKMTSFVENPKEMVEKWKEWQLELEELEVQKAKIQAQATEDDIMPESNSLAKNNINIDSVQLAKKVAIDQGK